MNGLIKWFAKTFYLPRRYWWAFWSHIYVALFQRKYEKMALPSELSHREAAKEMRLVEWTKDGLKELGDSVGSAGWFQYLLNQISFTGQQPKGAADCDNFSIWALKVLKKEYRPFMFCLSWVDQDGSVKGHAMCAGFDPEEGKFFHVGNWGLVWGGPTFGGLVQATLNRAHATEVIAWAKLHDSLYPKEHGFSIPE